MDDASALDDVFDMANLTEVETGIPGVVYVSTRQGAHGPRVKYFLKAGASQPSFSMSIEEEPRLLVSSLPERVANEMAPTVSNWVRLNGLALLKFWYEGDAWTRVEVNAHLDQFKKIER